MSTTYPNNIDSYTIKEDGVDIVLADDVNNLQDAIVAVETELGTDPKGTYNSVKARLDAVGIGTLTDTVILNPADDQVLQYNATSSKWQNSTLSADDISDGATKVIITATQETNFETAYTHSQTSGNPHSTTAAQTGAIPDADDTVKRNHIDWGTSTNQVSLDDVPNGATIKLGQDCSATGTPIFAGEILNGSLNMSGGDYDILIKDNEASALEIKEGINTYLSFDTTDSSEKVKVHKPLQIAGNYTLPVTDGTDNQVLTTDGNGNVNWETVTSGAQTLADLTDVNLTAPSNNQALQYDNATSKWINSTISADDINDGTTKVIITSTQESNFETAYAHSQTSGNPHGTTAAQVSAISNTDDAVKRSHIDWGISTNQVSLDDIPNGATSKLGQDCSTVGTPVFAGLNIVNTITKFSTDGSFTQNSDSNIPTEKAIKSYVDSSSGGGTITNSTANGRLTLTSGIPVTTSDVVGANTIYYTPMKGNSIALYNTGSNKWEMKNFSEISLNLSSLTNGKNYDVFAYWTGSAVAIELSSAWANDSNRTDSISRQNGVFVKSSDHSRRFVGTIRTTGTATTEDSKTKRFVWNMNNRKQRSLLKTDTTDSWTYSSLTWRQANGDTTNKLEVVIGVSEDIICLETYCQLEYTAGNEAINGIGKDAVNPSSAQIFLYGLVGGSVNTYNTFLHSKLNDNPTEGYHYYAWIEKCTRQNYTGTFYGDNGGLCQSGISGTTWA